MCRFAYAVPAWVSPSLFGLPGSPFAPASTPCFPSKEVAGWDKTLPSQIMTAKYASDSMLEYIPGQNETYSFRADQELEIGMMTSGQSRITSTPCALKVLLTSYVSTESH